ncbi:MAG: DnaJ domain-containing protein [Chloroflexi bacterium]|nr:DnaJ domain-containing protein [Chloroflexota bacterium]
MAQAKIIDYYAILNLPPTADLTGIENAYARLSDELALSMAEDTLGAEALARLNEAYAVLSRPPLRRDYDKVYFSREIQHARARKSADARRRGLVRSFLTAGLILLIAVQGAALAYIGREEVANAAATVFGPLLPGEAN